MARIATRAKAIVGALGYAASLATELGLTHYRWVGFVVAGLATVGIERVPNRKARHELRGTREA